MIELARLEKPAQQRFVTDLRTTLEEFSSERRKFGGAVAQVRFLHSSPEIFDRIHFGRIGRETYHTEPVLLGFDICSDHLCSMCRKSVPNEEQFASPHVSFQFLEQAQCFGGIHVSCNTAEKESWCGSLGITGFSESLDSS